MTTYQARMATSAAIIIATLSGCGKAASPPASPNTIARTVALPNGSLYVEERGDGPAVVLIHGGNLDSRMWDQQFDSLSRNHRVIRYDVRGFGRSSAVTGPFRSHDDLAALLDSLRVERTAIVGLSLGGRIAVDYALAHPDRVSHLVLSGPGLSGWPDWSGGDTTWYPKVEAAIRSGKTAEVAEAWLASDYMRPAMEHPELVPLLRRLANANLASWLATASRGDPEEAAKPAGAGRLRELKVPTLVLIGDRDSPPILRIVDSLGASVPGVRVIRFPGAGHMLNLERPAEFNQAVAEFLRPRGAQ